MADPRTIYRLLLKLYPARFREEYSGPLERQFRDDYREARGPAAKSWFWLHALADLALSIPAEIFREVRQDLHYAARIYRQRTATTALALAALALAIGATTGVFSVVNALLLRSLPFREPERLAQLWRAPLSHHFDRGVFREWVAGSPYLADAAAYQSADVNLAQTHGAVRIKLAETSAGFFAVLGAEPAIGRSFATDEDLPGRTGVAIISHALWQQQFGGDPRVLGRTIHLNGAPMTVIGVAPPGLDFPAHSAAWTPTAYDTSRPFKSGAIFTFHFGRLKPGVSFAQATAMFESEVRRVNPEALREQGLNRARLTSLRDQLAGPVRQASLVLMGVVGFVLLIACANVAHLLLSRVTERRQELVIRAALGASRARLVQQLITECTLLTLASAAAGMAVAYWASRLAASVQPTQLAAQAYTILDWHVLGFAVVVASATGLLFGVLPANLIGRMQPAAELARMQPNTHGSGARRLRSLLVAMQAAFTLILLSGAITLGRSFLKLTGAELGYRTDHIVTMNVALSGTQREDDPARYYNEALDRLRAIPGVEAAGGTVYLPLTPDLGLMGAGFRPESAREEKTGLFFPATAGYFGAMGTTILQGRDFRAADRSAAIVNEAFARQFPGTRSLVGQTMKSSFHDHPLTIVGIVRNQSLSPGYSGSPVVYVPIGDGKPMPNLTFVARVRGNTEAYLPVCRDALQSVEPKVPVFNVKTLDQRLDEALARPRFYTTAVLFFAVFALLLAVIGIYGVANFLIVQRTHEIGVCLAVGASPERLRATLLRQSLVPLFAGAAAGAAGAIAAGRVAESLIISAEPIGAPACAFAAALLVAVAAIAVWTATKRIVRLDPMGVLRAD